MTLRVTAETGPWYGLIKYRIERRGRWFWRHVGEIWAKTPEEALRLAGGEIPAEDETHELERLFRQS